MQEPVSKSDSPSEHALLEGASDLVGKAFQLAFFIIPDRTIALEILGSALSKLRVQRGREKKRVYWRDKYLKHKITRITRNEGDTLQWLVYFEAEQYEKRQEKVGQITARDMLVRYIKCLVQTTTAMSSFYVNVGVHRLLYNYSTSEARTVYEWVAQHYPGDQEYRKVKAVLMKRIQMRFMNFIRTCTAQYGELRFQTLEQQNRWVQLVEVCLNAFTPWSTLQACEAFAGLETTAGPPYPLSGKGRERLDQDLIETTRCHVFIEPSCHSRITRKLGLDLLQDRLAIPRFFLDENSGGSDDSQRPNENPTITDDERESIIKKLSLEADRRQRASAKFLRILVDGEERLRLDVEKGASANFEVQEGSKLIEIWTEDRGQAVLLATHWIEYAGWQGFVPKEAVVDLDKENELLIRVAPARKSTDDLNTASIILKCQQVSLWAAWRKSSRTRSFWFDVLPKYALVSALLVTVGWFLSAFWNNYEIQRQRAALERLEKDLARERAARASLEQALNAEHGASTETFLLVPDDLRIRGPEPSEEPVISFSGTPEALLELPIDRTRGQSYRAVLKPLIQDREILSESLSQDAKDESRGILRFTLPGSLVEDRTHYQITLSSVIASGRLKEIRKFSFYVKKSK